MSIGTILLIILILILVGALPAWPHSQAWGYGPSGGLGLVVVILLILIYSAKSSRKKGIDYETVAESYGGCFFVRCCSDFSLGANSKGQRKKRGQQMDEAAQQATEKAKEAGEAVGEKVENAGEYLDDAAITAKIKADILSDPLLKVLEINVTTTNGNVTLSGVVDSKESIDRALEIARRLKEVQSVTSSMVVKGAG